MLRGVNKRGQVTIFIIIAIVIIVAAGSYFVFRDSTKIQSVPSDFQPLETTLLDCLESKTFVGISFLETRGGYIELPDFEAGSRYSPFSSWLNFAGIDIPYWYYISGNNLPKEQIPTKKEMEFQLGTYLEDQILNCNLEEYINQGFEIITDFPSVKVDIGTNHVNVEMDLDFSVNRGDETFVFKEHNVVVNSNLGNLYDAAINIYEQEQRDLFLENYSVDILRLYAPVDGVELSCSPIAWNANEVFENLSEAIEINTLALKGEGRRNDYFVVDNSLGDIGLRFINSRSWPSSFEVNPSDGENLISKPVGNQQGLGILGFCYVPYHFVYDVKYPVLVQVYDGDEIFQFPLAIVLDNNKPRQGLGGNAEVEEVLDICEFKPSLTEISVYDTNLNLVDAEIDYECFGAVCDIGETEFGTLEGYLPQCVNGFISTQAEGFLDRKEIYSSVEDGSFILILDKLYERDVELFLDDKKSNKEAIISFVSEKDSRTIAYPTQRKVSLTEGEYEISVYIYEESSIEFETVTSEQCIEIPSAGILGALGKTKEECFELGVPEQFASTVLVGGGSSDYYILESELESSETIRVGAESLMVPESLEELQINYQLFDVRDLEVNFI
ncbi:hypothetical protein HOD29_00995 [archaeon]|jgi:hypothetical protein|nr:hypothetical protein [archaeon]